MMICNVHDRERRDEESSVQLKTSDTIQHEKRSHENQARATLHATHTSACLFRTQTRTRTLGHMLHMPPTIGTILSPLPTTVGLCCRWFAPF